MQPSYAPVKNYPDLAREMHGGAIVNRNRQALEGAKKQKAYIIDVRSKLNRAETEIETLKTQVSDMKEIFKTTLERLNK